MLFILCLFLLIREVIVAKRSIERCTFLLKSHEEYCSWTRTEHCALTLLHPAILLGWLSTLSPCTCQTCTIRHCTKTEKPWTKKHKTWNHNGKQNELRQLSILCFNSSFDQMHQFTSLFLKLPLSNFYMLVIYFYFVQHVPCSTNWTVIKTKKITFHIIILDTLQCYH